MVKVKKNEAEKMSIAELVVNMIRDHKALGTMLPRLPGNVQKEWLTKIDEWERKQDAPVRKISDLSAISARKRARSNSSPSNTTSDLEKDSGKASGKVQQLDEDNNYDNDDDDNVYNKSSFERSPSPEGASAAEKFGQKATQMSAEQSSKIRQNYMNSGSASSYKATMTGNKDEETIKLGKKAWK